MILYELQDKLSRVADVFWNLSCCLDVLKDPCPIKSFVFDVGNVEEKTSEEIHHHKHRVDDAQDINDTWRRLDVEDQTNIGTRKRQGVDSLNAARDASLESRAVRDIL